MKPDGSTLLFDHPNRKVRRTPLRLYLQDLSAQVAGGRAVVCLITTDSELQRLNREFRDKDCPTDVLSFPEEGGGVAGEIAISLDRAAGQAAELGHGLEDELRILMLHGVLHLTGMDHETDGGAMAEAEARWRKNFGLPMGLIERAASR